MTNINWTDKTWNPIIGCSRVSAGCENCYAERMAYRLAHMPHTAERYGGLTRKTDKGPRWTGKTRLVPEVLAQPLKWRKTRMVFVCSMADLFHESVSDESIALVFAQMAQAHWHTYQVLTKRPRRAAELMQRLHLLMTRQFNNFASYDKPVGPWPLPNVWLGVSVENQEAADERVPLLLQTPAAVRFVSAEPLLGPVDLTADTPEGPYNYLTGAVDTGMGLIRPDGAPSVNWVIAGGESGPGARRMNSEWARYLREQCGSAGVPFHFKQWGKQQTGRTLDGREWLEFPKVCAT